MHMFYELFYQVQGRDALTAKEHTHINQMEIIHILDGAGTLLLGENTYPFASGDVFLFDGAMLHNILPTDTTHYRRNKLIFEKTTLSVFADIAVPEQLYFRADNTLALELDQLFREILTCGKEQQPLLAASLIFKILHLCKENSTALLPNTSSFRRKLMAYINNNLQEPLSIDAIAAYMHISKFHMCKRFKDETGITIGNYIRMQRLYLAKKLLAETKLPISTIAMDCGFNDLAHFTKLFHTVVKMPPSAYRKQHSAPSAPF